MTSEAKKRDEKGRFVYSPGPGRPKKGAALRDLFKRVPPELKEELVRVAYQHALRGDYHWAEWIARHSGESGTREAPVIEHADRVLFLTFDDGRPAPALRPELDERQRA